MNLYDFKMVTINSNTGIYLIKMIGQRKTPKSWTTLKKGGLRWGYKPKGHRQRLKALAFHIVQAVLPLTRSKLVKPSNVLPGYPLKGS